MFPDTASIREIQRELDDVIQQGVQNITRLIRTSDPNIPYPLQTQSSALDPAESVRGAASKTEMSRSRGQRVSRERISSSLASRLVRDGLLTPDLLKQLQREWSQSQKQEVGQTVLHTEQNNKIDKRKKKK